MSIHKYNKSNQRLGEVAFTKYGEKMTIIKYKNCKNIDVQFEDGTIIKNKRYIHFKEGNIKNPNCFFNKRLGEISISKNGQKVTIIDYRNANDIDVQFEDGTIIRNKSYKYFKEGTIFNPNFLANERIGETNIATNGQKMTIIAYRSCEDIDVQFEDGIIIYNKSYNCFKRGNIFNSNCRIYKKNKYIYNSRLGEVNIATNGQKMTIIAYRKAGDIDIQFEDGTIVKNKSYDKFKNGGILNPNFIANQRIGETNIATNGQKMTIIEYKKSNNITIQFEDGTIVKNKIYMCFKKGNIENPNYKTKKISQPEFILLYYLKPYGFDHFKNIKGIGEIDCYNPDLKLGIEYDGAYWHAGKENKDIKKNNLCKKAGITLIRIRELPCKNLNGSSIIFFYKPTPNIINKNFEDCLKKVFTYLNLLHNKINIHVNLEKDKENIFNEYVKECAIYKNRCGKENIASNGQKMTIIAYRNAEDIDIQFEDGTIVKNKSYNKFQNGVILNPNFIPNQRIGETNIANNGQKMIIINYHNCNNIDVQFEDGVIVKNKSYACFQRGKIENPNYFKNKKIGQVNIATNGQKMTIINYINNNNIDVQFEDGTIVKNKSYGNFNKGEIANPNFIPKQKFNNNKELVKLRIGETKTANNGQEMTIINYKNCDNIDIQFEDGTIVKNKSYIHFKKGSIFNPNYTISKQRIGETKIANNGQKMTIIEYQGSNNISIQFEDGTIIKNKRYGDFKTGSIGNPNFKKK